MTHSIVFTGGGTAGHVTPNLALMEVLGAQGWQMHYIGSHDGIERRMMDRANMPYSAISTGKLRRYVTWRHVLVPFQVLKGVWDAWRHLRRLKPDVVFSKGGFVAFPVVLSAWMQGIPVVAHESDLTPGLANRLSFPFLTNLCVTFDGSQAAFRHAKKVQVTGAPIRAALFQGDAKRAYRQCGFDGKKPVLLVMGGSLGATVINQMVRSLLPVLCQQYHVIHLCGPGKLEVTYSDHPDYFQCEYAHESMADFFAASALVVSRAGSNTVYEVLALGKPHVFIPLSKEASRGDQIDNAHYFEKRGVSTVLEERALTADALLQAIENVYEHRESIQTRIQELQLAVGTEKIISLLQSIV